MTTQNLNLQKNHSLTADYQAIINKGEFDLKCIWVKKRISEVAFVAFALVGVALSSALGVIYIPLAIASVVSFLPKFDKIFYQPLIEKENKLQIDINNSQSILDIQEQYKNFDNKAIIAKLLEMGVFPVSIQHQDKLNGLTDLIPLIAQYDHWISEINKVEDFIKIKKRKINTLLIFDPSPKQYKIACAAILQKEIHKLEENRDQPCLLENKVKAAFMLKVISNAFDLRKLNEYGSIYSEGLDNRYALNQIGENPGFISKDGTLIDRDFILNANVREISKRIFNPKAL